MSEIIEQKDYSDWRNLVIELKNNHTSSKIYRGHSNDYGLNIKRSFNDYLLTGVTPEEIKNMSWPLISSFDRYYSGGRFYQFHTFLAQQLEDHNFRARFGKHNFMEIFYLKDCSLIERLYYLQHYGVPTCFLDFSHNPLKALFFGIASVRASSTYLVDREEQPLIHPNGAFISVFEFNHERISELLGVKQIKKDLSFMNYSEYKIHNYHIAFDISPIEKCQLNTLNDNMKRQEGCFVLYDIDGGRVPLDKFIEIELRGNTSPDPLIIERRLGYNDIFKRFDFEGLHNITLFNYLDLNDISGRTLFNDIQGLKYDLNFFHH